MDALISIRLMSNGSLSLDTDLNRIIFELKPDLTVQHITLSNAFKEMHSAARAAGEVDSVLDDEYRNRLKAGLLYFDGEEWRSTPQTWNKNN